MHWCHSLILRHATENSHLHEWVFNTFPAYCGKFFSLISLSLHLIKCYWSFGYHWHFFFTSMIEVKTQTRFMVLFTSGSLTTWGNLQMPHLASPPGICSLSTPSNQFPMSLQKSYDDRICLLLEQGREVEEGFGHPMGEFWHLSLPQPLRNSLAIPLLSWFLSAASNLGKHPWNLIRTWPIY